MANLGEYDEPSPCPKAYSRRLTTEQHEAIVSSETEKQLDMLLTHLKENPKQFSELLKKRKIKEMEGAGLLSNLKVKVLSALYGENFIGDIDPQTCQDKLKEFELLSVKVYNYSQEAKGNSHKFQKRYSKRIAERNKNKYQAAAVPLPPPPPPPPPLPPIVSHEPKVVTTTKQASFIKGKQRHISSGDETNEANWLQDQIKTLSKKIVKRRPLGEVSSNHERATKSKRTEESCSFQSELMSAKMNLRPICPTNKTPYQQCKQRRELENSEQDENRFPLFNQMLIQKFRNARSPAASPSEYSDGESSRRYEATP